VPAVEALARNIRRLADHCPVLMLHGTFSHEPPGVLSVFRLLGGRFRVHVADRLQQAALTEDGRWLESEGWHFGHIPIGARALFSCVPTVNKAVVAAAVGATEASGAVGEQLTALLHGYAPITEAARAAGVATIGVSHGTVYGCVTEHGVPMAGFDHEFTTGSLFGAGAQAFLLGHIHRHQSWEQAGQVIAYAGSIGRLHYGEEGDKGFLIWDVGAASARLELIATPARRTVEIAFDGMPKLDELQQFARANDVSGAFVRVRWTMPEEDRHEVDRLAIQGIFGAAAEVKLEGRVIPVVRTRAAGISQQANIAAKIAVWARLTEARAEPLLGCLEALQTRPPEEIAANIIEGAIEAQGVIAAAAEPDTDASAGMTADAEGMPVLVEAA
jgi:exonuclease SbcD